MNVRVIPVNFTVDQKLVEFIELRLEKLGSIYDQIVGAEVYLKVENVSDRVNKLVEMNLSVPGNNLIVKKQCKTFEEATDQCIEVLRRQVVKKKEKVRP
jgi:putative sigma-54 modulation protein